VISALVYGDSGVERYRDPQDAHDALGTTWVRATDADPDELDRVAEVFGLHPLAVEDVRNNVRPKTEAYGDHTFILVKTAVLRRGETTFEEEIATTPVGIFVGSDWLVTLSTGVVSAVDKVWDSVENGRTRDVRFGPDFAAYRVVDRIVDEYFFLLDEIEDHIEAAEQSLLDGPDPDVLETLNLVRRDLLSIRKLLWPTREAVASLARGEPDEIRESTEKYFRDVYDHLVQLVDLTETYRDLARGAREIYLSALSQSTNEVMKTLTVVATIILPLTFVVGVYGMNFEHMPELGWTYGYPAVVLGMGLVTLVLVSYFRREGWL
jgi:magnesium transporter